MVDELPRDDQRTIGRDIAKVQFSWPVGLPVCRPLSLGLWEVRSRAGAKRAFFSDFTGMLIALHAYFKKTRTTPDEDLALARDRLKELTS